MSSTETGLARNTDPDTAHEAADIEVNELEHLVLRTLHKHGPMTSVEIANKTAVNLNSINPRMRPLSDKGVVVDTGQRRKSAVLHRCGSCGSVETVRHTKNLIVWGLKEGVRFE